MKAGASERVREAILGGRAEGAGLTRFLFPQLSLCHEPGERARERKRENRTREREIDGQNRKGWKDGGCTAAMRSPPALRLLAV
eukprot:1294133-Rhodomonas_salina.2